MQNNWSCSDVLYVVSLIQLFCKPKDCSLPGSSVHGISQARILERVAIPLTKESSRPRDQTASPALAGGFFPTGPPGKLNYKVTCEFSPAWSTDAPNPHTVQESTV